MYEISRISFLIYLGFMSLWDIRMKKVPVLLIGFGILMSLFWYLTISVVPGELAVSGAAVGLLFLIIGKATNEALGYGDGLIILILGIYLGFWTLLAVLTGAYFLAAVFAGGILIRKGFGPQEIHRSFPFLPFLAAAYVLVFLMEFI